VHMSGPKVRPVVPNLVSTMLHITADQLVPNAAEHAPYKRLTLSLTLGQCDIV
jgi:hypothetical protein